MALKDTRSVIGTLQAVIGIVVHVIFFFFYLLVLKVPAPPPPPPLPFSSVHSHHTCSGAPGCPGSLSMRRRRQQLLMTAAASHPYRHFRLRRSSKDLRKAFMLLNHHSGAPGPALPCVCAGMAPGSHGRCDRRNGWPRAARARTSTPAHRMPRGLYQDWRGSSPTGRVVW